MRLMAVERGLARAGYEGEILALGPRSSVPASLLPDWWVETTIDAKAHVDPLQAFSTKTAGVLLDFKPDFVLVDQFWMPLVRILPKLDCEAWLMLRWCPPIWLEGPAEVPFQAEQYSRILADEPFDLPAITHEIDPTVICNPEQMHPPEALREYCGVREGQKLILAMQAGVEGELNDIAQTIDGVFFSPSFERDPDLFPFAPWLLGADEIHTGAGYNAFWESRWLGVFDRTVFHPFKRPIDNQFWRVERCSSHPVEENGADVLADEIMRLSGPI